MVWSLYNSDCTILSYTAYQVRKEGFENCSLLNLGRGALRPHVTHMRGSMRVESSFIDCWSLQSQEILALPLPILACLAFLPCRVSFEHNLAFRASIWGHNTNIDAEMSSAAPSNGPFRIKSKFAETFISFKLCINGKKRQKSGGTRKLEN